MVNEFELWYEDHNRPNMVEAEKLYRQQQNPAGKLTREEIRENIKAIKYFEKPFRVPKILYFDIETTGLAADFAIMTMFGYRWHGDPTIYCPTLLDTPETMELPPEKRDRELVKHLIELIDQADIVVAHYGCVDPEHKILMSDLTYKPAKELVVGDELLTFDETTEGLKRRSFKKTKVTFAEIISKPKLKIMLSDGTELKCSTDHPFLYPSGKTNGANWAYKKAEDFKVGDTLTRMLPYFEPNSSYHSGYLAASLDGEGHISTGAGCKVGFAQKDNKMRKAFDNILELENKYDFKVYDREAPIRRYQLNGVFSTVRLLGEAQPPRLIHNFTNKLPKVNVPLENRTTIIGIEEIGEGEVMGLSTEEGTYIAEGFPSHNSKFDCRFVQSRALVHGLHIADVRWSKIFDPCITARKNLKFQSNRLDNIAEVLGVSERKSSVPKHIWYRSHTFDGKWYEDAIKELRAYCIQDVAVLYEIAQALRPLCRHLPPYRLMAEAEVEYRVCRDCGSELRYRGKYYTKANTYSKYQCTQCGAWQRDDGKRIMY